MTKILKTGALIFLLLSAVVAHAQADFVFSDAQKPDSFSVAFQIKDSLIGVSAKVNGKDGLFILDNGCPYLVINSRYWQNGLQKDSAVYARGVGGRVDAGSVFIDSFNWQGLQKQRFKAVAADLPHLGDSICGLMGLDVYKDYRVTFDFAEKRISFVKAPPAVEFIDSSRAPIVVPFVFSGHVPVIPCRIEQQQVLMGIDCAAFPNLLSTKLLVSIKGISNLRNSVLKGGGAPVMVHIGNLRELRVGNMPYENMSFTFDNASLMQINNGRDVPVDGLLGVPFLRQHKTVLDFPNRQIEIY